MKIRHEYEVDEILELIGLINPDNNKQYNVKNEFQKKLNSKIKELNNENKDDIKIS